MKKKTTTGRGLGWEHQQQRERLLRRHVDGTPCPCLDLDDCGQACPCRPAGRGLPMYRDPSRNVDGRALQADHPIARSQGGRTAERLLLAVCNGSRGSGDRGTANSTAAREVPSWWTRDWTGERGW